MEEILAMDEVPSDEIARHCAGDEELRVLRVLREGEDRR